MAQSQDMESVAHQLRLLEEVVQELEARLEDARRGEAEVTGEVEFLRGEVERVGAEFRGNGSTTRSLSGSEVVRSRKSRSTTRRELLRRTAVEKRKRTRTLTRRSATRRRKRSSERSMASHTHHLLRPRWMRTSGARCARAMVTIASAACLRSEVRVRTSACVSTCSPRFYPPLSALSC